MATATKDDKSVKKDGSVDKRTDASKRRGRGELEGLVREVTESYEDGKITLGDDETLTPHRIAKIIGEKKGQDAPSSGAVAAILNRWEEYGYVLTHDKPLAYKRLSARGKKEGLESLKEKHREKKKAERAAAKESSDKDK